MSSSGGAAKETDVDLTHPFAPRTTLELHWSVIYLWEVQYR